MLFQSILSHQYETFAEGAILSNPHGTNQLVDGFFDKFLGVGSFLHCYVKEQASLKAHGFGGLIHIADQGGEALDLPQSELFRLYSIEEANDVLQLGLTQLFTHDLEDVVDFQLRLLLPTMSRRPDQFEVLL